jgi:hypothetical protein
MDDTEMKIIKAIDTVSPKCFISPVEVNKVLMLDANQLGTRLMVLKKSGHVDIMISEYPSSLSLPNAISKVYLTELGRRTLKEIR